MIKLENVSKSFHNKKSETAALKSINLEIKKGEIFGIIGHSGAGKSTLIRCLNLLERPTTGRIIIEGDDLLTLSKKELNLKRKKISMIFQHFYLMPSRSAIENVMFPLKDTTLSKQEKYEKAKKLLELVGLSHRIDTYPAALSGGEKQRVAIARALATDPHVLLCDEATSALDPSTTKSILDLLKNLNQTLEITIVLITHEMAVIKEICDRVAIMEAGEIKEENDVYSIFASPQSEIAKDFADSTNNIHKVYELLEIDAPLLKLKQDESLVRLIYKGADAQSNLLQKIGSKFDLSTNIVFGNMDIIKNQLLGNLVIVMKGEEAKKRDAIKFMQKNGVSVEVLKTWTL